MFQGKLSSSMPGCQHTLQLYAHTNCTAIPTRLPTWRKNGRKSSKLESNFSFLEHTKLNQHLRKHTLTYNMLQPQLILSTANVENAVAK